MSVLRLERLRTDLERADRAAVWLLLAVSVLVLVARHITPWILVRRLDDQLLTGGDVLAAMPVLLAAAAVLPVAERRPIVIGALLLAAAAVLQGMGHLSPLWSGGGTELSAGLGLAAAMLLVGGPLLIGHGLGGVHSRPGVALVLAGLVVSVLSAVYAAGLSLPLLDLIGPVSVVSSIIGQFLYLAWLYLLAAAAERHARLLAIGSGVLVTANLLLLALGEFLRAQAPGTVVPLAGEGFLLANFIAWAALMAGMLFEADKAAAGSAGS